MATNGQNTNFWPYCHTTVCYKSWSIPEMSNQKATQLSWFLVGRTPQSTFVAHNLLIRNCLVFSFVKWRQVWKISYTFPWQVSGLTKTVLRWDWHQNHKSNSLHSRWATSTKMTHASLKKYYFCLWWGLLLWRWYFSLHWSLTPTRRLIDAKVDWFTITGGDVHWITSITQLSKQFTWIFLHLDHHIL